MCSGGERQRHLIHGQEAAETIAPLPPDKIVGIVFITSLGPHAAAREVVAILIVVTQARMIVEIVLIGGKVDGALFVPQAIEHMVVLPSHAHFAVEVHGIEREELEIGMLINVGQAVAFLAPVEELLMNVGPKLIAHTHLLEIPRLDVEPQMQHRTQTQTQGQVKFLLQAARHEVSAAELHRCHILGVIAHAQRGHHGIRFIKVDEFARVVFNHLKVLDFTQVQCVVLVGRCSRKLLEFLDVVNLFAGGLFAFLHECLDGTVGETAARVAAHGHSDDKVAILLVLPRTAIDVATYRALHHIHQRAIPLVRAHTQVKPDANHHIGP